MNKSYFRVSKKIIDDIELAQMTELAAEVTRLKIKARRLPSRLVLAFSNMGETVAKFTKNGIDIPRYVRNLAADVIVDNQEQNEN